MVTDGTTSGTTRLERFVTRLFLTGYVGLLAVGAPFVVAHRSTYPGRVIAPFVAVAVGVLLLAATPRGVWDRLRGLVPPWVGITLGIAAIGGSLHFAHHLPGAYVSVLFFVLVPTLIAMAWSRAIDRPQPMLAALPFLIVAILVFGFEIPERRPALPKARWGDATTFAATWPAKPPYIGPGGRLRSNLDVYMSSSEAPEGVRLVTNSTGFRNVVEIPPEPAPGEIRILNLGDSFSIGMQIEQEHFFGGALETRLREMMPSTRLTVINAEVSDPAFGLFYLQQYGVRYRPDVVLLGLCGNDMLQAESFVGDERLFRLDGTGTLVPDPDHQSSDGVTRYRDFAYPIACDLALERSTEPDRVRRVRRFGRKLARSARKILLKLRQFRVFRALRPSRTASPRPALMHSYAARYERADGRMRLLDGTANLGYFYTASTPIVETLYERLFEVLAATDATARAAGARFVVVLHPQRFQVVDADWAVIRGAWCLDDADFDLDSYNTLIRAFCEERGILCLDPLDAFRAASRDRGLYLPFGDMHYNRAGHAVAAEVVARSLRPVLAGVGR